LKRITLANYRQDRYYARIVKATEDLLRERRFVAPVELFLRMELVVRQNFAVVKFLPLDVLLGSISRTESADVIALDGTTDRLVFLPNVLKGSNCEM